VKQSEKKDEGKAREDRVGSEEVAISVKNVAPGEGRKMTDAERRFEETQRLRVSLLFSHFFTSVKGEVCLRLGLILGVERGEGEENSQPESQRPGRRV
jgi:hypothetical protein